MSGNLLNINGAGGGDAWTPQQRKAWLVAKGAPDDFVLVTNTQMLAMANGMNQQRELTNGLTLIHKRLERALKEYHKTEPDMVNGVGAAVFDAERYRKGVDRALEKLGALNVKLTGLAGRVAESTAPTSVKVDLIASLSLVSDGIAALELILAQRRQRTPVPRS